MGRDIAASSPRLIVADRPCAMRSSHTWEHAHLHSPGQRASGAERFGINDYLTLAQDQPAQPVLLAALAEMFREAGEDQHL